MGAYAFLIFSAVSLLLGGCGSRNTAQEEPPVADTLEQVPIEKLFLPDTSYASAQKVYFIVEQGDTLTYYLKDLEDRYASDFSTFTFRRNLLRNASFGGTLEKRPDTVEIAWVFKTPEDNFETKFGNWGGGTGWTGQPIYVHWNREDVESFRKAGVLLPSALATGEEIIFTSLNAKAYFLDFNTGFRTRSDLDVQNTIKGSPSLDPEFKNLYIWAGRFQRNTIETAVRRSS